jgi:hypothetical protein
MMTTNGRSLSKSFCWRATPGVAALALFVAVFAAPRPLLAADCITVLHYDNQGNVTGSTKHGDLCKGSDHGGGAQGDGLNRGGDPQKGLKPRPDPGKAPPVPRQLVIADPPKKLLEQLNTYGVQKVDGTELRTLDVDILVVRVVPGRTVESVIKRLRNAFPGIQIDKHHTFDLSAGQPSHKTGYPIRMIGWGTVPQSC